MATNANPSNDNNGEDSEESVPTKKVKACDIWLKLPIDQSIPVEIAHVNSTDDFYVIRKDMEQFRAKMDHDIPTLLTFQPAYAFRPGNPCLNSNVAIYNYEGKNWKRVKFLEMVSKKTCSVQHIDWGDKFLIKLKDLKEPPEITFDNVPPFAIPCALDVKPFNDDSALREYWDTELTYALREDFKQEGDSIYTQLRLRVVGYEGEKNIVQLHRLSSADWGMKLMECGMARRVHLGFESACLSPPTKSPEGSQRGDERENFTGADVVDDAQPIESNQSLTGADVVDDAQLMELLATTHVTDANPEPEKFRKLKVYRSKSCEF